MQYIYAFDQNWEDYAAGRVLHNFPGYPAFPVRLASELFQRARAQWLAAGGSGSCTIFDPCCGGAYHLTTLGLLHSAQIARIVAADLDPKALELAALNLRLLTHTGLQDRVDDIRSMIEQYGKVSHQDALESALRIQAARTDDIAYSLEQMNALMTSVESTYNPNRVDIVFSDVPYGHRSAWLGAGDTHSPMEQFLDNLLPRLKPESMVIIAADKSQKIRHPSYQRLEKFSIGKRQAAILQRSSSQTHSN